MFARVVVDVPVKAADRGFTYRVLPDQLSSVAKGVRVIVPFGSSRVEGFIVELCREAPEDVPTNKMKAIIQLLDKEPVLNSELLALGQWTAERYFSRLATVWQTMLPSGIKSKTQRRLLCTVAPEAVASLPITDSEREILNYFVFEKQASVAQILDKFPNNEQVLETLKLKGYLKEIKDYSGSSKPQVFQYAKWIVSDRAHTEEIIQELKKRAVKQYEVARLLLEHGAMPVKDIERQAGSVRQALKALENKGFVQLYDQEVMRLPGEHITESDERPRLTADQQASLEAIEASVKQRKTDTFLLYGVTGSGKTEVYLTAIETVLTMGKQAIVLVPEISLTPQMVWRFKKWFGERVAVMHSRLSQGERYDEWRRMKTGDARIVVGARSAIFAPFSDIGIIIIDEEHESSYKQEENPRYDAREIALVRAKWHECPVVLGSATPSVESFHQAQTQKYRLLTLKSRVFQETMPEMTVVDMRRELADGNYHIFSRKLQAQIAVCLENGHQAILFINRRGHSNFVMCRTCGKVCYCPYCHIALTYHQHEHNMQCHYCNHQTENMQVCEHCGSNDMSLFGIGTEKIEEELKKMYPKARVLRMDVDTTRRKGDHQKILNQFSDGKADILIGTQMIAKGLDFPNVALVGVISADIALNLPDFRAAEKTFQLITQVGGRAGRHQVQGNVIVQTFSPQHYSIQHAVAYEYGTFYEKEVATRKQLGYPPFSRLIFFIFSHTHSDTAKRFAELFAEKLQTISTDNNLTTFILGPTPAPLSKIKNRYRYSLILKYARWSEVSKLVRDVLDDIEDGVYKSNVMMTIDVNPQMLL